MLVLRSAFASSCVWLALACGTGDGGGPGKPGDGGAPADGGAGMEGGGVPGCRETVDFRQGDLVCQARPVGSFTVAEGTDCVFALDSSILGGVQEVALNCPPSLDDDSPDSLAWIISYQERTLTLLADCSRLAPTDLVVLYSAADCVFSPGEP